MTADLVQFLRARLDEDAQTALGASAGPWAPWRGKALLHGLGQLEHAVTLPGEGVGARASIVTASWIDAEHIARHDPARVLAEVDAKRRILDEIVPEMDRMQEGLAFEYAQRVVHPASRDLLQLLALPYADHPEYREEWRP